MFIKKLFVLLSLFFSSLHLSAQQIPLEHLASLPDVSYVILSPNGKYIASLVKVDTKNYQGTVVNFYDIEKNVKKLLAYSNNEEYIFTSIRWGNNDTVLIKAKFPYHRFGTPTTETRLLKVDITTAKLSRVVPNKLLKKMKYMPNVMSTIVDILPNDDDHILMSLGGYSDKPGEAVVQIPISNKGKTKVIQKTRNYISDWITDAKHEVRIGVYRKKTTYKILEKKGRNDFKELWTFEAFSDKQIWPLGFGVDNNILYVKALYQGKNAIYKVDLTDPKLTKTLVFNHENYDVTGSLKRSKKTKEYVGVGYDYWDKSYQKFIKSIDQALPDTDNLLLDFSADGNAYLLFASDDNEPGQYYIGNRKEKTLKIAAYKYNKLLPEKLSRKELITYFARDGLEIEGYLTLPKGANKKNLPTIIFPHGGPISYDGSGFDYWTQFFANKGYAVLQMNFRGSSGYGHNFMKQGLGSWGQAMQDDVEDGTRWLIKEGITDQNNICIVGASYGGYAALMGSIKTPDLYQCAISFAGVTDVEDLVKSHRNYTNYDIVKKQVGNDYDQLWEVSPLKHAKKIKIPVLLIHGTKDRIVNVEHSEDMFEELEDENKTVQYIELEKGDHFLSNNGHRLQTFRAMDKFLDTYLPVN